MQRRSVSKQMQEHFERRKTLRRVVAVLYVLAYVSYLWWRYTIISDTSPTLSIIYYAAEVIGFILGLTIIFSSWEYKHRVPPPAPKGLKVDVLVPVYKEPIHIIRRTLIAAREISYKHKTYVLDDGKRDEIKAIAKELGITYLRRPVNNDAKAGNLNYGMQHCKGDYVMVFDADHIALPHALDVTLGFFSDAEIGMVQTPQDYYNTDAFQYMNDKRTGGLWHDQSFFYNIAQPCRDAMNGASCVGTGVVYRRSVLNEIGGIPSDTVTEDIHTSLKMHKAGYQVVYLNESIAYGVAASDLDEYYKTRHRWAHGNLHALVHEKVLTCKGLSLKQRLSYLTLGLIYLEGWQQLLLFFVPAGALVFGWQPFEITIFNMLVVLAFPFINYALLQELGCGFSRFWVNEIFAMARWPVHIAATPGLLGWKIRWRSSAKNVKGLINWRLMLPQMGVLALSLFALGAAFYRLWHDGYTVGPLGNMIAGLFDPSRALDLADIAWTAPLPEGYTVDLVAVAGFFALYNVLRVVFFMVKAVRNAHKSHTFFRFKIPLPVLVGGEDGHYGRIRQISETWVSLIDLTPPDKKQANTRQADKKPVCPTRPGDQIPIRVMLPTGWINLTITVDYTRDRRVDGRIVWTDTKLRDTLARSLYSVDWHREFQARAETFLTPTEFVTGLIRACAKRRLPSRAKHAPWRAVIYNGGHYGIARDPEDAPGKQPGQSFPMIVFEQLTPGRDYAGLAITNLSTTPIRFQVVDEEPLSSLTEKGLDGKTAYRYRVKVSQDQ